MLVARGAKESSVMRSRRRSLILTLIIGLLGWATVAPQAQVNALQTVSPFDIVGFIEAATVTPAANGFSGGGTITVNGTVVTVPTNTLLQMPAFALTWQEVFTSAPPAYRVLGQSGMAMADLPTPLTTYEVHIQGNRVGNQYIAGLMFISQQSLNTGAGFINFIDYSTPGVVEMRVGGLIGNGATGARVRINDPAGKFGPASHVDDRFTIDEDNPTVRAETGYPMCLPRTNPAVTDDPLCPQANRPQVGGNYLTIITMDPLPFDGSAPLGTNPLMMAPFEVGDFVDYNGILVADGAGTYIDAWGVIANVGLYTAPGTQPVYTAIDVMILGTGGAPNPALPQEAAIRTRMEGFTTDPTSFVDLFATDVDACTGAQTLRYYTTIGVDPGPPTGTVAGRWRWRPSFEKPFLPASRMLTAISENGMYFAPGGVPGTPNGILAGYYTAPNFEFIFAEALGVGNAQVPNNFLDFPFLTSGSGPYPAPGAGALGVLGQLSPWPDAVAPPTPVCSGPNGTAAYSPIADAGLHQSVRTSTAIAPTLVTMDGANSRDTTQPMPLPLSFLWAQGAGGPRVVLTGATTATPTFTAPNVATTLTFTLRVSNGLLSSSASVTIAVTNNPTVNDTVTITSAIFRLRRSQIDVLASTTNPAAVLTLEGFGVMGPAPILAAGPPVVPAPLTDREWRQVGVNPAPTTVTVRSSLGGTFTLPVTVR
jgi:hypothetical protein